MHIVDSSGGSTESTATAQSAPSTESSDVPALSANLFKARIKFFFKV